MQLYENSWARVQIKDQENDKKKSYDNTSVLPQV